MIPNSDYLRILPELVLCIAGMLVMLIDPLLDEGLSRKPLGLLAFVGTLVAFLACFCQAHHMGFAFYHMIKVDAFSVFFHALICVIAGIAILGSFEYLNVQGVKGGEYYALILFGAAGMVLMSSAVELVLIFIALEISSISTYILAGFRRRAATSAESAMKYFLLGSFATAFFLYGVALIFGATGSTNIYEIANKLQNPVPAFAFVALALMFVGLAFKIASAPFHIWTPDVYEGAPAPVVGLMSTAPKAAAFAVLLHVLFVAFLSIHEDWFWLIWISAALSMTIGNIGALVQGNVKRLLAYSSIAHAGYILVAVASLPEHGIAAASFYTAIYAVMNLGAFLVVSHFARSGEKYVSIDDYSGLGFRSPILAATLTLFMLSFIGIPLTAGFFGKFYVFSAALQSNQSSLMWLTVIGLINSAIAAYYYLRLVVVMYMREPKSEEALAKIPLPASLLAALALCAAGTIYLGVAPGRVLQYVEYGAQQVLKSSPDTPTAAQTPAVAQVK